MPSALPELLLKKVLSQVAELRFLDVFHFYKMLSLKMLMSKLVSMSSTELSGTQPKIILMKKLIFC